MKEALFRKYAANEVRADGYPEVWPEINAQAVVIAGHRCERCGHPYRKGQHGSGEWSPCDEHCTHSGVVSIRNTEPTGPEWIDVELEQGPGPGHYVAEGRDVLAKWRILTVHHLNGDKADCRWWNLAALCQRCHLTIQGRVKLNQVFPFEHSDWFKPHAAGYYAVSYLSQELDRAETLERMDELLQLERIL